MKRLLLRTCVLAAVLTGLLGLLLFSGCSVRENGHWEWGIRKNYSETQADHFSMSVLPYDYDAENDCYRSLLLKVTNTSDGPLFVDRSQSFFTRDGRLDGLLLFEDEAPLGTFDELAPVSLHPGETLARPVHPEKYVQDDGKPGILPLGELGALVTVRRGVHSETAEASVVFEKYWVKD
ncbi:MAG: hypothetical protein ACNI3A_18475 [Desulfovibrio sp.]|uniref:hypothetical protein n=1 Tax=Desulfovibrio sp. 7SRBS1 TaxID=3378064 RepID=UPI003B41012A